ncbi:geranylgeranyl transferase type-2 subunit alpha [Melopsittacus undulatus]|uniref:geranylgeranyl transferase type-2 subunit alpha n=1 Tax=Melopsittacus undulatus TaxID=13146 RepID=UPI00146AEC1F|nr:geranylgeranyl transferase type-2 subunit alpha [Melopsittacus undulatus]
MHGRLKSRPPDAARLRQREEKLRKYRESMRELRECQQGGAVLELTASVLAANPDVATCWGRRREALLLEPPSQWVDSELGFVASCLALNPKSYGAWHHRAWTLRWVPAAAAAAAELALCERHLAADPRNFHAWEHRRALTSDPSSELQFTQQLLARDFSNYSAWHQRLKLLQGELSSDTLRQELELVRNAAFTDPHDQSAWIYLRCALSQPLPPPRILSLYFHREDPTLAITFSRPIVAGPELGVILDGDPMDGKWRSAEGGARSSHTWLLDLPPAPPTSPLHIQVTWAPGPAHCELTLQSGENEAWWQEPIAARELFWPEVGVSEAELLQAQAQWCRELRELEPQSRGCLLALALLLWALEPLEHEEETRSCLQELKASDPMRRGFACDAASRLEVAAALLRRGAGPDGELRLRGKALTSLPLLEHMALVPCLDLAHNALGRLPAAMGALRRLKVLDVAHNNLRSLQGFPPLPWLEEMGLEGNPISHASALSPLAACPRLARLRLAGTPLASAPDAAAHVTQLLPRVDVSLG